MLSAPIRKIIFRKPGLARPALTPALQAGHVVNVNTRIAAVWNGVNIPIDLLGNTYVSEGSALTNFSQSLPIVGPAFACNASNSGRIDC
jgi:hypothetical protein